MYNHNIICMKELSIYGFIIQCTSSEGNLQDRMEENLHFLNKAFSYIDLLMYIEKKYGSMVNKIKYALFPMILEYIYK